MTQDATTPLDALNATLAAKLGHDTLAARQSLIADGINPDAKVTFDEHGNAPMGADAFLATTEPSAFYDLAGPDGDRTSHATVTYDAEGNRKFTPIETFEEKLANLEAEGHALLQTAEAHVEAVGHAILALGHHQVTPAAAAPHDLELARALPLARAGDLLHESEYAIVRAFMDAEDVLRHVYLNIHGLWVKA